MSSHDASVTKKNQKTFHIRFVFFSSTSSSPVKNVVFLAPPFNCASFISHLESTLLCLSMLNPAPTQYGVVSERVLAVRGQALWAQEEQAGQTHTPVMRTSGVAFPTAALSLSLSTCSLQTHPFTLLHHQTSFCLPHPPTTPPLHNHPNHTLLSTHLHARSLLTASKTKSVQAPAFVLYDMSALGKVHIHMAR